jgi:peptide/nickel transport system substrate-binding protein
MTDIVGSTEHAAEVGDSGWRELVQQHHALVRASLRRHGGREIDTAGDGFFAVFDAPAAAVDCALEIAQVVRGLGIEIRAGVHVGEVEQMAGKVGGIAVPIASRIMSAAGASEVLVSATARDLATGSGLTFVDRGVRELKGVPGEWHVYAVSLAMTEADNAVSLPTAQERRAAAVRWSQTRPVWQRRPRLTAGITVIFTVVVIASGLLLWRPWQPPALASLAEDSVGVIDPDRDELVGQIQVGAQPGGIAVGGGYAWVTNTGAGTVSQIDLRTHSLVVRIDVGRAPKGIAVAEGSVWVANSGERVVSRINAASGRVVQSIEVGNGPTAIAAAGTSLWVANATDSTVVAIDARSGAVGKPIGVAATPIALAFDEGGLWVASEDGASVSHLDPATGGTLAAPVQLAARPSALALDEHSVWIASVDGTVTRIDRTTHGVKATIDVGGRLSAIAHAGNAIWVGDQDGIVHRLDAANPSEPPKRISTSSAVASLAVVDGDIWLAGQASAGSHRGGTLHIVEFKPDGRDRFATDPLDNPFYNVAPLEADGLVAYRRVGGTAGSVLLPDLATSVPRATNGGLTYTFHLRPNLRYSTGVPVRASDFRRGLERSFMVAGFGVWGPFLFGSIDGAKECTNEDPNKEVEQCELPGVTADEASSTVTFNLSKADPDFVYKLANPAAYPVPEGVPMREVLDGKAFPGTGPYVVSAVTNNEVRLRRNPRFRPWDGEVRPDGFPNEILFTVVARETQPIEMVEKGDADYTRSVATGPTAPEVSSRAKTQYAGQWHVGGTSSTIYVVMNSSIPPFDKLAARQAVNFAIDRAHMADLAGGSLDVAITCQLLPTGFPGYRPYCPYTARPDQGGRWKAPDMQAAQQLVDASGTRGAHVTVGPTFSNFADQLAYLKEVLEQLGYKVSVDNADALDPDFKGWSRERTQVTINGWAPDYVAPGNFLQLFTCDYLDVVINYCNPEFDAAFKHALELQTTDPAAALVEWEAVDRRGVDLALLAPMFNPGADFVSARVGNYQFNPAYAVLFDQMWVQ